MPTIKISDLHPTGSELFHDSESYMNELGDGDLDIINGGFISAIVASAARVSRAASGAAVRASKAAGEAVYRSAARVSPYTDRFDPGRSPAGGWF
jgi:hypothetical protein